MVNLTLRKEPVIIHDNNDTINPFDDPVQAKTLTFPADISVPTMALLPSLHSPDSSLSSPSSASSTATALGSSTTTLASPPHTLIKWTAADLNYLLSILYSALVSQNRLFYSPSLESLNTYSGPIHLQLFVQILESHTPLEAFSRHAPVGTGRPVTRVLLAESGRECGSSGEARKSLARSILERRVEVHAICAKYTVLSHLFVLPLAQLHSLHRGMKAMAQAGETERWVRLWQLQSVVDELCEFDLRLETFLLEAGREELETWIECMEVGLGLRKEERERWAGVYGEAGAFLREVCRV